MRVDTGVYSGGMKRANPKLTAKPVRGEPGEMLQRLTRNVRALVRTAGDQNRDSLEVLAVLVATENMVNAEVKAAAVIVREHGYTYNDIARELGISRQAAWKRFGDDGKL